MSANPSIRLTEPEPNSTIQEPESECPKIGYISDDLVVNGLCPETAVTPAVAFKYHPVSAGEYADYMNKLATERQRGKSHRELERVVLSELVQRYLRSWDLRKPDGSTVDFKNMTELQRVPLAILDFIGNKITETSRDIDKLLGK